MSKETHEDGNYVEMIQTDNLYFRLLALFNKKESLRSYTVNSISEKYILHHECYTRHIQ